MMESTNQRKKPARTDEEQEKFKQKIIDMGRELFASRGSYGFNTRELAKRLKMSQGNLYNYFESKRELWIAIRTEDFKKYKQEMEVIVNEYKGSYISLIEKLIVYYLDFAKKEYRRFQMMFTPAPRAKNKKIGPIEKNYQLINPLDVVKKVLKNAMDANEIKKRDVNNLAYYIFALSHGATIVERDFRSREKIYEPINQNSTEDSAKEFRKFLIRQIIEHLKFQ